MRILTILLGLALATPLSAEIRDYEVFAGDLADPAAAPIVMVLHGGGGSGPQVRRTTGFDRFAAQAGVVAVYPSGDNRVWNDGRMGSATGRRIRAGRDDVADLIALARRLEAEGLGDADRLFLIGHSNGGGMAMRVACARPDALAGIAVVATKVLTDAPCADGRTPVPAVFFFGTADELNPHAGRQDPANRRDRVLGLSLSAAESLSLWARRNGCGARGAARIINPADDGVVVRAYDWQGCHAPLRYYETEGGGHAWPGARPASILSRNRPEVLVRDIDAGREALAFFAALGD
ncbi:MAG: hypothetical protein RLZZ528_2384 [Pseudomonadota bacterium]